ncbi:MAG: hypothetical protein JRJ51_07580 [Deltaproteobacteria bacterium]|nr:hypothetical protein [Deltaproteobacteria bacterium]
MESTLPEKARLLERLREGGFNVPDFIYVPAGDFRKERFVALKIFLDRHKESFKVIARSAHPKEEFLKPGTLDSLETYADLDGIKFARNRIIHLAQTSKKLSILRQQAFNEVPEIDLDELGVIVMPFIDGTNVMGKMMGDHWEFGYCRDRIHKIQTEPYITTTPSDRGLLQISEHIQNHLGFRCEIEFIISGDGEIHVVQAKDISHIETLTEKESDRSITLDGVRRIRKRRNYRERIIYVMDSRALYLGIINKCEDLVHGWGESKVPFEDILAMITDHEADFEDFALKHQRFGILGLSIKVPEDLYQIANHYLEEMPDYQKALSRALHDNLYKRDYFLSETDTIIAKDKIRVNLCSHDAYGIASVRNPLWSVYWNISTHDQVVKEFVRLGFKTGDTISIDIGPDEKPTLYRL